MLDVAGNVDDLFLTFSLPLNILGTVVFEDLILNGSEVPVTEQNKKEYVRLVSLTKTTF